jgi:cellulose synthase/poly-beta-1,6-N-acetylglucosamine synthase-like glycosyltransferase
MLIAYVALILSAALVFHIIAGYPLLLALRWGNVRPPIAKDPAFRTTVSVILAVHNGEALIRRKLEGLLALDYPHELLSIIVVSDGSTDGTEAIVREFDGRGVTLLATPRGGKAAALNYALTVATGEILFFTDVRQPLEPGCLRHLVANFADPTVGAVTGELHLLRGDSGEQADMNIYWRYEIWARQRHSAIDSLFNTTGCIYAMRRSLARPIPGDTLTDDAMLPLRAFFEGYRVIFDPAAIAFDYPAVAGTEFRRRFRTLAGLWQVYTRLPALFTRKNRMRFHFLSHKFGRLMLPWLIIVIFSATIALDRSWFRSSILTGGAVWLLLALSDGFVAPDRALKRLTSPARTFLVMNTASLASIAVFFVPATRLWTLTKVNHPAAPGNVRTLNRPNVPPPSATAAG